MAAVTTCLVSAGELVRMVRVLERVSNYWGVPSSMFVRITPHADDAILASLSADVSAVVRLNGVSGWIADHPIYVDRRMLFPFISTGLTDEPYKVSLADNVLTLKHTRRRAALSLSTETGGYPAPPKRGKDILTSDVAVGLLQCAASCGIADPVRPEFGSVMLIRTDEVAAVEVMSSNQIVLFYMQSSDMSIAPGIHAMPMNLISLLPIPELQSVAFDGTSMILRLPSALIWCMLPPTLNRFPIDVASQLVKTLPETIFNIRADVLSGVVHALSTYMASMRRRDWCMDIMGSAGDSKVTIGSTAQSSRFDVEVDAETLYQRNFLMEVPLGVLVAVFDYLSQDPASSVAFCATPGSSDAPVYITNGQLTVVVSRRHGDRTTFS